jgi:hypothetical protein
MRSKETRCSSCVRHHTICSTGRLRSPAFLQFIRGMASEVKLWSSRVTIIIIFHADTDAPYDILGAHKRSRSVTVHYIDNTGGVTINRCSSTVTIHDANEVGDVELTQSRTIYRRFLSQTQTPHTGSLYGTEGFRRVGMEI